MVGNISSGVQYNYSVQSTNSNKNELSSTQLETISSVLASFDSENLSAKDATSIVNAFKEAGIQPSKELAAAMQLEGFDAKEVGELAGVQRGSQGMPPPPPPPPPSNEEEQSSVSSLLDSLLELDNEEENSTLVSSFDEVMEYTSRILNLNDESKNEVMKMLERLSNQDSQFSSQEKSNIVKNSLTQILSDSDNYNRISFYA
jgi:hypothetical protein